MSTPINQLPGIQQRPPAGPPPALTREQLNTPPVPQFNTPLRPSQQSSDGMLQDDDATIAEVFEHLNGEAAQRVVRQQPPAPQQPEEEEEEEDEGLYYPQQTYSEPEVEVEEPPPKGVAGWWRHFFGVSADASSRALDIQMLIFLTVVFFAASLMPVTDFISRFLPFAVGVPNAELGLKAVFAAVVVVGLKRWNDSGTA